MTVILGHVEERLPIGIKGTISVSGVLLMSRGEDFLLYLYLKSTEGK